MFTSTPSHILTSVEVSVQELHSVQNEGCRGGTTNEPTGDTLRDRHRDGWRDDSTKGQKPGLLRLRNGVKEPALPLSDRFYVHGAVEQQDCNAAAYDHVLG